MSTQTISNSRQLPNSTTEANSGTLSHLTRQLSQSAKGFFSKKDEVTPITPSQSSTPGTPAVGDVTGNPTSLQRFLSLGKTRKDGGIEFPPASWDTAQQEKPSEADRRSSIVLPDEPASVEHLVDPAVTDSAVADSIDPPPEPLTLARRIQALLSSSPALPTSDTPAHETADNTCSDIASHPPPALVTDPKLVTLLSSTAVMNGTLSKSGQSVWSVLDKLRAQLPGQSSSSSTPATAQGDAKAAEERVLDDDDSGVMIYGPLLPNDSSEVELARSTDVDEAEAGKAEESAPSARPDPLGSLKGKLEEMWPFKAKEDGKRTVDNDAAPSTSRVHFQPVQPGKPKRVWIPSPDKISIQVMWWGYRIYLPPPVLDILDNKKIEGAKRAAMLTAALKWALDRVPLTMIPVQARPAMLLLKAFTPYLGYVGGYVVWSWSAVKSFDKGHGVTLTATWLLTVAVIPGTWEEKNFPQDVPEAAPHVTGSGKDDLHEA